MQHSTKTIPEVSVCIPTYCRYPLLVRALNSVLRQDFKSMEILISDNASPDASWLKTEQLHNLDDRIVIRRNESNLGWIGNINHCIKIARGEFIVFLCDDDELLPGMIELTSKFLKVYSTVGFVHTAADVVSATGRRGCTSSSTRATILSAGLEALTETALSFQIAFSSVMVRKSCFERLGYFMNNISSDYEMWSRISVHYDVGYINRPLVRVYQHVISPAMTVERYQSESERLGEYILSYFPDEFRDLPSLKRKLQYQLANGMLSLGAQACIVGDWKRGRAFFSAAHRSSKTHWWRRYVKALLYALYGRAESLIRNKDAYETHV